MKTHEGRENIIFKDQKRNTTRHKRKRQELLGTLQGTVEEWGTMEALRDDVTEETRSVLMKGGKATTDLLRKVLRDGMNMRETSSVEGIYKYNDYTS